MWRLSFENVDPATISIGPALLSAVVVRRLSSRQWELQSELLAWLVIPLIFKHSRRGPGTIGSTKTASSGIQTTSLPPYVLWVVAASIVTSSFCWTENNLGGSLAVLVPLLLIHQEQDQATLDVLPSQAQSKSSPSWRTILAIAFAVLTLTEWNVREIAVAVVSGSLLTILYVGASRRLSQFTQAIGQPDPSKDMITFLSSRVAAILTLILCLQAYHYGLPEVDPSSLLFIVLAKVFFWHFAIHSVQYVSWSLIPFIATFALTSTQRPYTQLTEFRAMSHVGASIASLDRIISMLPKKVNLRSSLWILLLLPVYPYFLNFMASGEAQAAAGRFSASQGHPVDALIQHGKSKFAELSRTQSKTYDQAVNEYRRRYRIDPPPGFDAWYKFANSSGSPIIDDYDTIHEAISPFLGLSGNEVRLVMQQALKIDNHELWSCAFTNTSPETKCTHPTRDNDRHFSLLFNKVLEAQPWILPDITILLNHLDEPRLLLVPDADKGKPVKMTDLSTGPTWNEVTKHCHHWKRDMANMDLRTKFKTFGLPFVTDPTSAKNLCENPEFKDMHGLLVSPPSFKLIEGPVPILSTGALSTMGDILFPSPAYIESDFEYNDQYDIDWEKKYNNLYWAGSSTGGYAKDSNWQSFHRQRFVAFVQNLGGEQKYYYLRLVYDVVSRVRSRFLNGRLYDVAFSRIFSCEAKYCRDQELHFNLRSWAHKDEAFRSRLVFDLDGNGISGRYYKLLASKSTPLKQTLLREWHDERLVPWVHYVPVSQSMEELPELVTYFTSTRKGQARAKEIAEQGREWSSKALRGVDLSIYNYRLLLELARLQDPNREAIA